MWTSVKSVLPLGIIVTVWYTATTYYNIKRMTLPPDDSLIKDK